MVLCCWTGCSFSSSSFYSYERKTCPIDVLHYSLCHPTIQAVRYTSYDSAKTTHKMRSDGSELKQEIG
jgi:hypothetical protein